MSDTQTNLPGLDWATRRAEWDTRVKALGTRAVFHLSHKTPEQQAAITAVQREVIFPLLQAELKGDEQVALDFGCGYGRWTGLLAETIKGRCLAIDPTPELLSAAMADYEQRQLHQPIDFALYKNGHIPADDASIDLLWSCMVLSTILDDPMLAHTLTEFDRVLKPGGLLFIVDNTEGRGGRPVRSRWSMSRTYEEYRDACGHITTLRKLGHYEDLGEINSVMAGRKGDRPAADAR